MYALKSAWSMLPRNRSAALPRYCSSSASVMRSVLTCLPVRLGVPSCLMPAPRAAGHSDQVPSFAPARAPRSARCLVVRVGLSDATLVDRSSSQGSRGRGTADGPLAVFHDGRKDFIAEGGVRPPLGPTATRAPPGPAAL